MANYRRNRINEEVQKELNDILRDVKDPRVSDALITVTAVDVTPDLKFAKVFFSTLGRVDEKQVMQGLKSAGGFIRGQVAKRLNLRQTPEFSFVRDRSMENGAHISMLLRSVEADLKDDETEDENQ